MLIPITKWSDSGRVWPSVWAWRKLIWHREFNGIEASGAIRKIGSRWFVDSAKFDAWLSENEGRPFRPDCKGTKAAA
ncbi:MAG: hypothetical protein IT385_12065 [Deltaproteobacteria bacterium]|nr:hypothetical protein [Deltaproteobacteria bacterium]